MANIVAVGAIPILQGLQNSRGINLTNIIFLT